MIKTPTHQAPVSLETARAGLVAEIARWDHRIAELKSCGIDDAVGQANMSTLVGMRDRVVAELKAMESAAPPANGTENPGSTHS